MTVIPPRDELDIAVALGRAVAVPVPLTEPLDVLDHPPTRALRIPRL